MTGFQIFLSVIFGIIALFVLILSIPLKISIGYDDKIHLSVKYLFIKLDILPSGPKKKKAPKKEKSEKPKKEPAEKQEKPKEKLNSMQQKKRWSFLRLNETYKYPNIHPSSRLPESVYILQSKAYIGYSAF